MDKILNFVALRPPLPETSLALQLADPASALQRTLDSAAAGPAPQVDVAAALKSFIDSGHFVRDADTLPRGAAFVALVDRLSGWTNDRTTNQPFDIADIVAAVREAVGNTNPADWAGAATQARDSVIAAYLLMDEAPSPAVAVKLVRGYALVDAALANAISMAEFDALLKAPLVLPAFLVGWRGATPPDPTPAPATPDEHARLLLDRFRSAHSRHTQLTETLAEIAAHDEDELVLSELGERKPLLALYRNIVPATSTLSTAAAAPALTPGATEASATRAPTTIRQDSETFASLSTSPLRRAAARSNVVLSDTALRLLSTNARDTFQGLGIDPAVATVQEMQTRSHNELTQTNQAMLSYTRDLSKTYKHLDDVARRDFDLVLGPWRLDPIDDPATAEPVAPGPPGSFNSKVKPLGVADLFLVRTHLARYERGEVAALENILGGEKLTHTARQSMETETTETSDREQTNLQSLAQTTAEQSAGKTTAQAVGAGRGPLTSDGPESFSRAVTDQVSSSSSNRTRSVSVLRRLQRLEDSMEHVFDNSAAADVRFGVYQWLDKVYQAQVFRYGGPRMLYDLIVPEPAALFREALARPRGQGPLPARPAPFTLAADKLSLLNWSYYATGHQASGVEGPPAARIVVTEAFGAKAPDPFSGELNANNCEIAESRLTRIPRGYAATEFRLTSETSGWTIYRLRAVIGTKLVSFDDRWGGHALSGKLEGEVESLPVGVMADGNGANAGLATLVVGIEIICEPTAEAISAWQTRAHGQILAANQRRFADFEERVANRDASAKLQLQALSAARKAAVIQSELKRSTLAVLTNQNFSGFNASKVDSLGFPYPDAAATTGLSAYIRFFEQAVEWEHLEYAVYPYFWGSRSSWVSKLLGNEANPAFAAFLDSGAARVVLPIRPGYERAFERFLNTGKTPTTDELLDVGGPLWVSLVAQLRAQGAPDAAEVAVGEPWEFRLASDLIRARRDGLLPRWTLNGGAWVEQPDAAS